MTDHSSKIVKANAEVIGREIRNQNKEDLGRVEELVLDKVSGNVRYVVLSFGGFLGLGDKFFALPWKQLEYSPEDKSFIIGLTKEKLEKAPGFDKNNWPDMADPTYQKSISDYYEDTILS